MTDQEFRRYQAMRRRRFDMEFDSYVARKLGAKSGTRMSGNALFFLAGVGAVAIVMALMLALTT